uniref:F-box/LRR-repeat protein 21 n=1 Tax=Steinernema glaseri TaxID=37863 RepID=A0A1I7ZFC2_9BILA
MDSVETSFINAVVSIVDEKSFLTFPDLGGYWGEAVEESAMKKRRVGVAITVSLKSPDGEESPTVLTELMDEVDGRPHYYYAKLPIRELHPYSVYYFEVLPQFTEEQMEAASRAIVLNKGFSGNEWQLLLGLASRDCRDYNVNDLGDAFNSLNMASIEARDWHAVHVKNCAVDVDSPMAQSLLDMLTRTRMFSLDSVSFDQSVDFEDTLIDLCVSRHLRHLRLWNCDNIVTMDVRFLKKLIDSFEHMEFDTTSHLNVDVALTKQDIKSLTRDVLSHKLGSGRYKVHWFVVNVDFGLAKFVKGTACCPFRFDFNDS